MSKNIEVYIIISYNAICCQFKILQQQKKRKDAQFPELPEYRQFVRNLNSCARDLKKAVWVAWPAKFGKFIK